MGTARHFDMTMPPRSFVPFRGMGPAKIDHLDRERVITIQANTENRALTEVIREFEGKLASFPLPAGYEISQGGQTEDQQEVFTRILVALGVALILMYLVLVVQFGSFLDPLAILLSLPLSLIGGVITSTVLTLLVIPTVYDILSEWRDRAIGLMSRQSRSA